MVLDDSIWQEIAKWFAGIAATLATLFLGTLRWWVGDRFQEMSERLDDHDSTLEEHEQRLSEHHETVSIVMVHIENGKEERRRIETGVDNINKKLDRLVERS